jgi:hypothetical protein
MQFLEAPSGDFKNCRNNLPAKLKFLRKTGPVLEQLRSFFQKTKQKWQDTLFVWLGALSE